MPSFISFAPFLGALSLVQITPVRSFPFDAPEGYGEQSPRSTLFVDRDVGLEGGSQSTYPSLLTLTIDEAIGGFATGQFTSEDLVTAYLRRIAEVNPLLHAVTEVNPDALDVAKSLDAERTAGIVRGPLHGVPIVIKNNIATDDKMNNTAGSYALLGSKVPEDSTVVTKLRDAGAIILGKANMAQWAGCRSTVNSNGWSAYGGQVYGAYYPFQEPSGSSSGSAVSASIGLSLVALGTETGSSISAPSSQNGVVGIKPSTGLTSRHLVIPWSSHQDTVGPIARTVKDAAYVLQTIAGTDPKDNYTSTIPFDTIPDYVAACQEDGLRGARIGVPRNAILNTSIPDNSPIRDAYDQAIDIIRALSANVSDPADFVNMTDYNVNRGGRPDADGFDFMDIDFYGDLAAYLAQLTYNPYNITGVEDLILYTESNPLENWPNKTVNVWQMTLNSVRKFGPYGGATHWEMFQERIRIGEESTILATLEKYNLDALVMPTTSATGPASIGQFPIVTVPLGFYPADTPVTWGADSMIQTAPGVPFGLSFVGPRFSEEKLIKYAYAFEQATKIRSSKRPMVVPNIELAEVISL